MSMFLRFVPSMFGTIASIPIFSYQHQILLSWEISTPTVPPGIQTVRRTSPTTNWTTGRFLETVWSLTTAHPLESPPVVLRQHRTSLLSHQPGNNTSPGIQALISVRTTSPLSLKSAVVTTSNNLGGRSYSPTRRLIGRLWRNLGLSSL